jgi:hypothetical protein
MFITNLLKRISKISPKQLTIAAAFVVALAGAVSLGQATKQTTHAADCSTNAILRCGVSNPNNFIDRVAANDQNTQGVYAGFGLDGVDYARFRSEAKQGIANRNGTIVVDGRVVATDAWSIGRSKKAHSWNWNGFWADSATVVNRSDIPVMVLFDENGAMEFAVMYDCGNPTTGNVIHPSFECKSLSKSPVTGEKDTYMFTVDAPASNGATVARVVYNFGDGTTETRSDLNGVKHKFTRPGNFTVTVSVTFNLPGGKTKTVEGVNCRTQVTVVAPFYQCVQLIPTVLNDKKTQFRFTVKTSQGNGATLKDVDFTLDGKNTTTGVVIKDADGNVYKDYSFDDAIEHTILAKVNFNVADGVQSKTCEAKVTPEKQPMCTLPGKEMFPPNAPECQDFCKPNIPKGDARCEEVPQTELPKTGPGNMLGLFGGTSALGAVAHRVVSSRRQRRGQ